MIIEKVFLELFVKIVLFNFVLVVMYGGLGIIGKSGFLKFDLVINQVICVIFFNKNILFEYLYYFIMFFCLYWMVGVEGIRRDLNIS